MPLIFTCQTPLKSQLLQLGVILAQFLHFDQLALVSPPKCLPTPWPSFAFPSIQVWPVWLFLSCFPFPSTFSNSSSLHKDLSINWEHGCALFYSQIVHSQGAFLSAKECIWKYLWSISSTFYLQIWNWDLTRVGKIQTQSLPLQKPRRREHQKSPCFRQSRPSSPPNRPNLHLSKFPKRHTLLQLKSFH